MVSLRTRLKEILTEFIFITSLQLKGCGPGTARERTRTTITAGLKKKLKDLMGE